MVKELNSDYHFTHELPYQKELGTGQRINLFSQFCQVDFNIYSTKAGCRATVASLQRIVSDAGKPAQIDLALENYSSVSNRE